MASMFMLATNASGCLYSVTPYEGDSSPHFDGERFSNQDPSEDHGFFDFLKWATHRDRGPWRPYQEFPFGPPPPKRTGPGELRVTFVNHATVLIQIDGLNLLTDPIWSTRAGPESWIGPRRARNPGIRLADVPPIDAVLLSHNHYDHMDLPTIKTLNADHHPRFFSGLGNGKFLRNRGVHNVTEMDWWQWADLQDGTRIHFVPAQHFSSRGLVDRNRSLWGGFVVLGKAGTIYFAGDTGLGPHFEQIKQRFGSIHLAILPIGAFRPTWFMGQVHLSPEDAVNAHLALGAKSSMAMHFGTFALADDGQDEPVEELTRALDQHGLGPHDFFAPAFGEGRSITSIVKAGS